MGAGGAWLASAGSSTAPRAIDTNPAAAIAAIAFAMLAGVVLVFVLRSRRLSHIEPAGPSLELRPETPALVDLLTGGFEVEDDAVPATVVHLAARRWFTIEDYGDDTIIRTRTSRPPNDSLQPYEQQVLAHIERHAIDSVVPTRVLTIGPEGVSDRWFRNFSRGVTRHGQQLGLCVDRWSWGHRAAAWLLVSIAIVPAWIVADNADTADDPARWATLGNVLLGLAFVVAGLLSVLAWRTNKLGAQRDTPEGITAAAHWMGVRDFYRNTGEFTEKSAASVAIWDAHLAYATAMGLAHEVQRQIPFETEHDRHAWSRATGQWRRVKVRYTTVRPGWGRHPVWMAVTGLFLAAVWGAVAYAAVWVANFNWRDDVDDYYTLNANQEHWISLGATLAASVALALASWMVIRFLLGCVDTFRKRTVEGELVRCRSRGGGDNSTPTYHLAIDTATNTNPGKDSILAYRVRSQIYHQVSQGSRIRAVVTPWLGYVREVETLVAAPAQTSFADGSVNAEEAVAQVVGSFAGFFVANEDARAHITNMLQDPNVANSSTGKFLEAFLKR